MILRMELLRPGKTSKQGEDGHCCNLGRQQVRSSLRLTGAGNIRRKLLSVLQLMISTHISQPPLAPSTAPLWGKGASAVWEDNTHLEREWSQLDMRTGGFCSAIWDLPYQINWCLPLSRGDPGSHLALAATLHLQITSNKGNCQHTLEEDRACAHVRSSSPTKATLYSSSDSFSVMSDSL